MAMIDASKFILLGGRPPRARLPGLVVRYHAQAITGLASSDPIVTWSSVSPNGGSVTQATSSKRGIWMPSAINGNAAGRLDGTDDYYSGSPVPIGGPFTIYAVVRMTNNTGNKFIFECGQSGTDSANYWLYFNGGGAIVSGFHDGTNYQDCTGRTGGVINVPYFVSARYTGSIVNAWRNGIAGGTPLAVATTPRTDGTQTLFFGSQRSAAGSAVFAGDISEGGIFNRALSDAELDGLHRELSREYGIAIV